MSIIISNAFKVIEGRPVTSSRIVAEYFGKKHSDAVRAINSIIAKKPELLASRNYAQWSEEVEIGFGAKRMVTGYWMDQKGFCILAMGFTGAKALEFKCAFYDEFERVENELRNQQAARAPALPAPSVTLSHEQRKQVMREVGKRCRKPEEYKAMYGKLKRVFGVKSYVDIPSARFADALAVIEGMLVAPQRMPQGSLFDGGEPVKDPIPQDVVDCVCALLEGADTMREIITEIKEKQKQLEELSQCFEPRVQMCKSLAGRPDFKTL